MEQAAEHLTALAGPFYGNGMSRAKLDAILARHWSEARLKREVEAVHAAWFDHRFAHPALRSHFFAHSYIQAWRIAMKKYVDWFGDFDEALPWMSRDLYSNSATNIASVIDVMHLADESRLPYDVLFTAGFQHLLQEEGYTHWKIRKENFNLRGHKLPPLRLFARASVIIAAKARLDTLTQRQFVHAKHPFYRAENWRDAPWQREHVQWLLSEAKRRGSGSVGQVKRLLAAGLIPRTMLEEARSAA